MIKPRLVDGCCIKDRQDVHDSKIYLQDKAQVRRIPVNELKAPTVLVRIT